MQEFIPFLVDGLQKCTGAVAQWCRSSHQRCSVEICVLKNSTKFTRKNLCQSLFFNKVVGLRPATLLKKGLWHKCFLVNFVKFLRPPFLQNASGRLLLVVFCIKSIPRNFSKFTGKHVCQVSFLIKLPASVCNFITVGTVYYSGTVVYL